MDKLPQDFTNHPEQLALPPKDLGQGGGESDNIFKFPPDMKDLRQRFQRLLDYAEREEQFYKSLGASINNQSDIPQEDSTTETFNECKQDMEVLEENDELETSAALATYGTIRELTSLYTILDELSTLEEMLNKRRSVLKYTKLLRENAKVQHGSNLQKPQILNNIKDTKNSISLLDAVLTAGNSASNRRSDLKQQRERSKCVISEGISTYDKEFNSKKESLPLRSLHAPNAFTEGKSKVSKWTKVKAAFKWERANVPALGDVGKNSNDVLKGIGLMPLNNEVARYLRVPSMPHGGTSSADSILSSTSALEVCTPGTISSASSMDEIDSMSHNSLRRESSKSDVQCNSRISDEGTSSSNCCKNLTTNEVEHPIRCVCNNVFTQSRTANKSFRKHKLISDFEVLPEDGVANITTKISSRIKVPPSPLNLQLQQDLNDLEDFYLLQQLKTPRDSIQQGNRMRKISSPGNSSVPSSPSRLSEFFAEFESEDLSSGDFSEPTSPNCLSPRKIYQYKQNEINRRYELLRKKLDMEFETKRREWEKMRRNANVCRAPAYTLVSSPKIEETQPSQAKLLEENLTPEFKKKLQKWRVKKQNAPPESEQHDQLISSNKETSNDSKTKIDWNLWKAGQIKLEGQGLTSLPEHKSLPEEFQKKLEQWNKLKKNSNALGGTESVKRTTKSSDDTLRKSSDDDRIVEKEKRGAAHKVNEKDKLEKISKLKAIVADHPVKEVQVKTSAGVMKFEGISRKFTRKLYEWEKARGIGPESSTFALLHPGYCPIDVGRISKESQVSAENSPTLSRSLSLDSITPNLTQPNVSQQASSLSLNDVNDLKDREIINNNDVLAESEYKKFEEPEAVMVEVEDHIVETAKPLVTAHALIEQQTPIYKFEKVACNDFCNTKHIQSYESHSNLAPLLAVLNRTDELLKELETFALDMMIHEELQQSQNMLAIIRTVYPTYTENLMRPPVLNAISDVQSELSRLNELLLNAPVDEACCQEIMEDRSKIYSEELKGLNEALELLRLNIEGNDSNNIIESMSSNANITPTVVQNSSNCIITDATRTVMSSNSSEFGDAVIKFETSENSMTNCKNTSNTSIATTTGSKKKMRLRRMGSRQNSKTESDSSDNDAVNLQETPRRWKRKNYRIKQRSFDAEDFRKNDESVKAGCNRFNDDMVYVLRVKPGHPIEQCEIKRTTDALNGSGVLISPTESCVQLMPMAAQAELDAPDLAVNNDLLSNIFVKTIRKIFRAVEEPNASCGMVVVEQNLDENSSDMIDIDETQLLDINNNQSITEIIKPPKNDIPIVGHNQSICGCAVNKKESLVNSCTRNENKMKLKPEHCKLRQWSWSWNDIRDIEDYDKREYQSNENLNVEGEKGFKAPLATDSFKINKKNCFKSGCFGNKSICVAPKRKEHLFKKNTEKFYKMFSKSNGTTIKKVAKTNAASLVADKPVEKSERKFSNDHTFTPVVHDPHTNEVFEPPHKLLTSLSERAQRLQRAKQNFLEYTMPRPKSFNKRKNDVKHNNVWEQNHLSDNNTSTDIEEGILLKSLSAGTILQTRHDQQSDTTFDTLPRTFSSRSEKLSTRLGFASIASKFRRTKKEAKQPSANSANAITGTRALSTLCRQSLFADHIAVPQAISGKTSNQKASLKVKKSQSLQAAMGYADTNTVSSSGLEKLNKSQSEQYVRSRKESLI